MKITTPMTALAICALLSACASVNRPRSDDAEVAAERSAQRELIFDRQLRQQRRLDGFAIDFLRDAAPLCGDKLSASIKARVANIETFEKDQRETAKRALNLDDRLAVLWTLPDETVLQAGDRITAIAGQPLLRGADGLRQWRKTLDSLPANAPLALSVERGGRERALTVSTRPACDYPVLARNDSAINAYNDGRKIVFFSGLMNLFPHDRDLAVILGHELAHGTRNHVIKSVALSTLFSLLDGGPGDDSASTLAIAPFSRRMEAEADYTGLYMAALAGHDLSQAEQVWREMGINVTASSNKTVADTHPSSPERFVAIKRTVAEIQAKQQAGQPLRP